jgi:hypothetical protein
MKSNNNSAKMNKTNSKKEEIEMPQKFTLYTLLNVDSNATKQEIVILK